MISPARQEEIQDAVKATLSSNVGHSYSIPAAFFNAPEEQIYAMHVGSNFNPAKSPDGGVYFRPKKSSLVA